MSKTIKTMSCYLRNHAGTAELVLLEDSVKIVIRKKEISIPFDSIISVIYKKPSFLNKGTLEFKTAQAGYGAINWGFGISTQLNDANTILNGEVTTYYINGKEKWHGNYVNGKREGYFTLQMRDGGVAVIQFVGGKSVHNYFMITHKDGSMEKKPLSEIKSLL